LVIVVFAVLAVTVVVGFVWYSAGGDRHTIPRSGGVETPNVLDDELGEKENEPHWQSPEGYIGSLACRDCHRAEYESYLATSHSRALTRVDAEHEPPDAIVEHELSWRRFRVTRSEGLLMHAESLKLNENDEIPQARLPANLRVGSGHFGRTYLCEANGFFVESPLTWYEPRQAWGLSPGYDAAVHQSFTRMVPENCLLCHAGRIEKSSRTDFQMRLAEHSIGCERCHGPGQAHVERQSAAEPGAATDDSIVNPRHLNRALSQAVCEQCHLQGDIHITGRGTRISAFRPGMPLEQFRVEYRMRRTMKGMTIVGHVEQLEQSPCYRRSETLTCLTCHDPHRSVEPEQKAAQFRAVCLGCHADQNCSAAPATRAARGDDCVTCHMPRAETEIPHVAFTHHHIGIHPLKREFADPGDNYSLIPISRLTALSPADQRRAEALAYGQLCQRLPAAQADSPSGRNFRRSTAGLLASIPAESVDAAVEIARAEFSFRNGDKTAALESARRTLEFESLGTDEEARARAILGFLAMQQNDFPEAREQYTRLTRLRRDAGDWHQLGLCENNCGRVPAALRALEKACEIDPASIGSYEARAAIHQVRKETAAERQLREVIERLQVWKNLSNTAAPN
jgi:predicted CXXCH cytochrome family protein